MFGVIYRSSCGGESLVTRQRQRERIISSNSVSELFKNCVVMNFDLSTFLTFLVAWLLLESPKRVYICGLFNFWWSSGLLKWSWIMFVPDRHHVDMSSASIRSQGHKSSILKSYKTFLWTWFDRILNEECLPSIVTVYVLELRKYKSRTNLHSYELIFSKFAYHLYWETRQRFENFFSL